MISLWSILSGSVWFALVTFCLWLLRGRTRFLMKYGVAIWSIGTLMSVVRILLPFDSEHAVVIRSYQILVALDEFCWWEPIPHITMMALLKFLWAVGAVVGLVWVVRGALVNQRRLHRMPPSPKSQLVAEVAAELGVREDRLLVTSAVSSPVAVGIVHPTICLPETDYSHEDLRWILVHEKAHITHRDSWWRLGYLLFRCAFWWNPFVHLAQKGVDELLELRCDQAVLKGHSEPEQLEYVEALTREAERVYQGKSKSFAGTSAFLSSRNAAFLVRRAQLALTSPPRWHVFTGITLALSVLLFFVSYFIIFQPAGPPPDMEDGVEIYIISPETTYLVHTPEGQYEVWYLDTYDGTISAESQAAEPYNNLEVHHEKDCCSLALDPDALD